MKHILKLAMKNEIPKNILNRKKRGFTPPIINWLNRSLTDLESKYLSEQQIRERKLIDYEYVKKISEGYKNGKTSNYVKIWSLICLESWFQSFFKKYKIMALSGVRGRSPRLVEDKIYPSVTDAYHGLFLRRVQDLMEA